MRKACLEYAYWKICIFWVSFFCVLSGNFAQAEMPSDQLRIQALEEKLELYSKRLNLLERFSFGGDFRLRYEGVNNGENNIAGGTTDSYRGRFRFRLFGKIHLNKDLDVGFRVSSGGTAPTTTNDNFDETASFKGYKINRAYVRWTPGEFVFQGGKFAVPFMRSEMVWAVDVNLEGFSQQLRHGVGDVETELILGQFVVEDNGSPTGQPLDDVFLLAIQGRLTKKESFGSFLFGLAYYDFKNLQGSSVTNDQGIPGASQNNKVGGLLVNDFNVVDAMAQFKTHLMGQPLTLFGEYGKNIASGVDFDTAWELGFQLGKANVFGDWRFGAFYRLTQLDAVFSAWNSADFHAGGTNSKGVRLQLQFALTKGVRVSVSQFMTSEERGARFERDRTYADLVFRF